MNNLQDHRMISISIKLKKFSLFGYYHIFRPFVFFVVIISVSFCTSSTCKKNNEEQQKLVSSDAGSSSDSSFDNNKYNVMMHPYSNGSCPYDLNNPDEKYSLPKYLEEVSGVAYYNKDEILCVQDEKANIYVLNLDKEEIVSKYDFGKDGDYEDIALVGQTAYVIRNDGRIFGVENFSKKNRTVKEYGTPLSEKNDTEGLTYDKLTNSLFITCKGSPAVEKDNPYKGYKAIYQFSLEEMKLIKNLTFWLI